MPTRLPVFELGDPHRLRVSNEQIGSGPLPNSEDLSSGEVPPEECRQVRRVHKIPGMERLGRIGGIRHKPSLERGFHKVGLVWIEGEDEFAFRRSFSWLAAERPDYVGVGGPDPAQL